MTDCMVVVSPGVPVTYQRYFFSGEGFCISSQIYSIYPTRPLVSVKQHPTIQATPYPIPIHPFTHFSK